MRLTSFYDAKAIRISRQLDDSRLGAQASVTGRIFLALDGHGRTRDRAGTTTKHRCNIKWK
jgi:hypothetical protein